MTPGFGSVITAQCLYPVLLYSTQVRVKFVLYRFRLSVHDIAHKVGLTTLPGNTLKVDMNSLYQIPLWSSDTTNFPMSFGIYTDGDHYVP